MTYSQKLKDPRWQKKRLRILDRDKFSCRCCKSEVITLHVHHLKYSGNPWDAPDDNLITLCEDCHSVIEATKHLMPDIPPVFHYSKDRRKVFMADLDEVYFLDRDVSYFLHVGNEMAKVVFQNISILGQFKENSYAE